MSEAARVIAFPQERTRAAIPNDVIWDACVEVLGYAPLTATEKRIWGKMTHSLTDAGADRVKILKVAQWYHRQWPNVDLTIMAIEKWYSHFLRMADEKDKIKSAVCVECEMGGGYHASDCSSRGR